MLPIAEKLAKDGVYEPVFFVFRGLPKANIEDLHQRGYRTIQPKIPFKSKHKKSVKLVPAEKGKEHGKVRSPSLSKKILRKALRLPLLSFLFYLVLFGYQLYHAKHLLRKENAAALLIIGDRHVGWETAMVKMANRMNIPSLIVPFAISDPKGSIEYRLRHNQATRFDVKTWFDRLLAEMFPSWVSDATEARLFFCPLGQSLAAKVWGIMPDNPWVIGGGAATCMAVESPRLKNMFELQGVPPQKMVVTGKPSLDQVVQQSERGQTDSLREQQDIPTEQPLILCSIPQLGEHGILPWPQHWQEVEFLLNSLTQPGIAKVVISLHPKSDPQAYQPLLEKYGVHLAPERIYQLIPECDLFVATYSSTVVQAIGFGKPTIVVDFYGLNYTFYDGEPGIVIIRDRDKLIPIIEKIITDPDYYRLLADAQRQRAPEWILMDGRCTHRLLDLMTQLITREDTFNV
ncbi:MAG: hypothetical protein MUO62_00305 [Anaerolineales bacterium]|nr:hypothetical protein [Anaerolineales bacterium]